MFAFSIPVPPVAIAWVALSVVVAILACGKGHSFVGWMIACIVLTPFVAVILFFLPPAKKAAAAPVVKPPPIPKEPSLLRRVAGAASWRVKESRAAKVAIGAKTSAHRSLENFANRTELDRDIAKSVEGRFGREGD